MGILLDVILATTNPGKLREFRKALEPIGWQLGDLRSIGHYLELPEETGTTFEENAILKASFVARRGGETVLADDSGLEIDALDGEPGVYSARYGNCSSDAERNALVLEKLKDIPAPRVARFVCVLALAKPNGDVETYRGELTGEILDTPRGTDGFGYDPIFYLKELGKTLAELSLEEKNQISHRAAALRKLFNKYSST